MKFTLFATLNLFILSAFGQAPTVPASNLNFTNILCNQFDVNWTNGNGTTRLVFVKEKSSLTSVPTQNEFYTPNSIFGMGEHLGLGSGAFCVYRGTGSSLTVTRLKSNTRYYVAIFEYNSASSGVYSYLTSSFPTKDTVTRTIVSDFTITSLPQCFNGNIVSFKNTSYSDFLLTYIWDFGDGETDTSSKVNVSHHYKSHGEYNVRLMASATGCNDTAIKREAVYSSPIAAFDLDQLIKNNDSIQCFYKNKFTFQNKTTLLSWGSLSWTHYWWFADSNLFATAYKASISFTSPGLKTVKLVAISDKNCKDSITHYYKVIGNIDASKVVISPKLMPLATNKFSFVNNNTAFAIQKWYIKGKTNPAFSDSMVGPFVNYTFKDPGTYYIILRSKDTAGCVDMLVDSVRVYSGSAGLKKNLRFKISIYPNPSEFGIFHIHNLASGASIKVYDMIGKEILNLKPQKSETDIDLSGFGRGMYYLSVSDEFNKYTWKLIY